MLPAFLRYSTLVIAPPVTSQKREWPWRRSARTWGKWRTM